MQFARRIHRFAISARRSLAASTSLSPIRPYIPTGEIATLDADVRDYDPRIALDGGADGMAAYRAIAADAKRLLAPGAHLVVEIGFGQRAAVCRLFAAAGLGQVADAPDLAGIPRAVCARRDP